MTELELWLKLATRQLSRDDAAKVRTEISEHFEASRDAALSAGATADDAARQAIAQLGDPRVANCGYRQVLLTSEEARLLSQSRWEANAVCSRSWIKPVSFAAYLLLLIIAAGFALTGHASYATDAVCIAFGMSPFLAMIFVPIDTPTRGLLFRCARWITMGAAPLLILGSQAWSYSWLLISCFAPLAVAEITRASIRRKLPVQSWPRHLYL